ncbi:MAG TPA: hypothetical protein VEA69_01300 [Tepidisphaeraceae bacterium]|nr:hypothetical protein [Tepidisphaeraceae bacterium]
MLKSKLSVMVMSAMFVGIPALAGCDREVASETKVRERSDGSTKVEERKVVEKPDGTLEKTTEKKTVDR